MNNTIKQQDINPVAILVFDRSREKGGTNENQKDVVFTDASCDCQSGKKQNTLLDDHLHKILNTYEQRKNVEKYAHLASFEEIQENDFNLSIPRYVDTFGGKEKIDIAAVQKEIEQLDGELVEVRAKMASYLKDLGVTQ